MAHAELVHTEFFNGFLARDGLCWRIDLHAFDGAQGAGRPAHLAGPKALRVRSP